MLQKLQELFIKMYKINQDKIREGLHQEIKGTLNRLEIRLNSPHQQIEFIGALSDYYIKRQEAINLFNENEKKIYDNKVRDIFRKFSIQISKMKK